MERCKVVYFYSQCFLRISAPPFWASEKKESLTINAFAYYDFRAIEKKFSERGVGLFAYFPNIFKDDLFRREKTRK